MSNMIVKALPYSFTCDRAKTALIVIDMQKDFCMEGGFGEKLGNDIQLTRRIIPQVQMILEECRKQQMLIIHTQEGHLPDLSDCPPSKLNRSKRQGAGIGDIGSLGRILVRGEEGYEIIDELRPEMNEYIVEKPGKGAFYQTNLAEILRSNGIESLIVTGVTTHVCVHSTVREANDRGYECLVLEDATASFEQEDHDAAIRMIHQQGAIFGWVSKTIHLMKALTND